MNGTPLCIMNPGQVKIVLVINNSFFLCVLIAF